jgi:hypothetical protein
MVFRGAKKRTNLLCHAKSCLRTPSVGPEAELDDMPDIIKQWRDINQRHPERVLSERSETKGESKGVTSKAGEAEVQGTRFDFSRQKKSGCAQRDEGGSNRRRRDSQLHCKKPGNNNNIKCLKGLLWPITRKSRIALRAIALKCRFP